MSAMSSCRRRLAPDRALRIEAAALGVSARELAVSRAVAATLGVSDEVVIAKTRASGITQLTLDEARRYRRYPHRR